LEKWRNAVGAYSEMASGGSAGVELWVPVFRIIYI
jgi:hypothetical protein